MLFTNISRLHIIISCLLALSQSFLGNPGGLITPIGVGTQPRDLRFEHIWIGEGSQEKAVYDILQDRRGFLWVATSDGLYRYDGYGFAHFPLPLENQDQARVGHALALNEDKDGLLWVGSSDGLLSFDTQLNAFHFYQPLASSRFEESQSGPVHVVYEDLAGMLWVGTERGLEVVERKDGFTKLYHPYMKDKPVRAILEGPDGALWIGTAYGLDRLDVERRLFSHVQYYPSSLGNLALASIRALYFDQTGLLWIGTDDGLISFNTISGEYQLFQSDPNDPDRLGGREVLAIDRDEWGGLWLTTADGGLSRYDLESRIFRTYRHNQEDSQSLSEGILSALYFDREGIMWLGGEAGYLDKSAATGSAFTVYKKDDAANSLSANSVQAVFADGADTLWVGSDSGLDRVDRSSGQVRHYGRESGDETGLSANSVQALYGDNDGILWIGTVQGLDRFDPITESIIHFDSSGREGLSDDFVTRIYADGSGILWIGTANGGLNRYDQRQAIFHHFRHDPETPDSLSDDSVKAIHQDRQGDLWVGTNRGLNRLIRGGETFERYLHDRDDPTTLSNNFVLAIHEDRQGDIWVGTYLGGLNKFDRQLQEFVPYAVKDGLAGDIVYGILEDELGRLWISTNNGLSRFDPVAEMFTNYSTEEGLQGTQFNSGAYFKSRTGEMFFGGTNGLTTFYPRNIQENMLPPSVVLLALRQDGLLMEIDGAYPGLKEVTLVWPDNSFEFEYAALSFSNPAANEYAYRLEGFDDWQQVGNQRIGSYQNLPAGNYRLLIRGSNNQGVWNEIDTELRVVVQPPFWRHVWFQAGILLVLMIATFGFYRLRLRSVELRRRQLETQVAARTAELEMEMANRQRVEAELAQQAAEQAVLAERNRLAQELHDAVSQSLYSANLMADTLPRLWELDAHKARQQLADLQGLTRGALAEMRAMLLELRPENLDQTGMGELLDQLALGICGRTGIKISLSIDGETTLPRQVKLVFYRIAQEALNNIARHAQASLVRIGYFASDTAVKLQVSDNGVGFNPDAVPSGRMGIAIMHERATAINAVLKVISQEGQGAEVSLEWHRDQRSI